ncbi:hypothetical protein HMPREF1395_01349 [Helicobacter pylori GAM112Ai]|nr:hypothetical protein HMPREF1395_01349 [Helicobacter pylori GAM112Ai]EMH32364.1 hypothetical protein HMPREF1424_01095 [Helicobacter pylori GAM42Ai]
MVEEIKVGESLVLALYPYDRDFIGFECPMRSIPTRLRKILFNWIVGVKSVSLLGLNIL